MFGCNLITSKLVAPALLCTFQETSILILHGEVHVQDSFKDYFYILVFQFRANAHGAFFSLHKTFTLAI